jgi:predicted short-subunit dehydrogenase-like oxidoreductase (DUF2520 family)
MSQQAELPGGWCDVVGRGRMGRALATALRAARVPTRGPLGRGADASNAAIVLLCVPDREIGAASAAIAPGPIVAHVSASAPLSLLEPHDRFTMHPLLTVVGEGAVFTGVTAAVDGNSAHTLAIAHALATRLGMRPREIPAARRALYHASASTAANFLVTVLGLAEQLAQRAGLDRADLEPLVRAAVENWTERGAQAALTGPVARGDEVTVERQRAAVLLAAPETIPLWDALVAGTRDLAQRTQEDAS